MNAMIFIMPVLVLLSGLWYRRSDAAVTVWNVSVSNQLELNQFIENVSDEKSSSATNYFHVSMTGGNVYELDIVKFMNITIAGGSLIMESQGNILVEINCTAYSSHLEELRKNLNPLSRASLVLLDGLVFTGCPVPILIEEASHIVIQNCVFQ